MRGNGVGGTVRQAAGRVNSEVANWKYKAKVGAEEMNELQATPSVPIRVSHYDLFRPKQAANVFVSTSISINLLQQLEWTRLQWKDRHRQVRLPIGFNFNH